LRKELLAAILSISIALSLYSLVIIYYGGDPIEVYIKMVRNAFLDLNGFRETVKLAASLGIISLGLAIAFKAGIWNIGGEGQYIIGGLAAAFVVYVLSPPLENPVIPLIASAIAGGIYTSIPSYLKYRLDVNEVLSTLMLNYVALYIMFYYVYGGWRDPATQGFPVTPEIPYSYRMPIIFGYESNIILLLLASLLVYLIMYRTRFGFKIKVYGLNRDAYEYAGYSKMRMIFGTLFISGLMAGLAGGLDFTGNFYRLRPGFASGLGYTAIIVSLMSSNNPMVIPIASILFSGFLYGSYTVAIVAGVPTEATYIMHGLLLLMVISRSALDKVVEWIWRMLS